MGRPEVKLHYDVGDAPPGVELLRPDGRKRAISRFAGRPAILHVIAPADERTAPAEAVIRDFAGRGGDIARAGAQLAIVRQAAPVQNLAFAKKHGLPEEIEVLADATGALARDLALGGRSASVVFDRASRLAMVLPVEDAAGHAARVIEAVRAAFPPEPFRMLTRQAPVMLVPGALSADYCRHLIAVYHEAGSAPSGFMETTREGQVLRMDPAVKVRRDHVVPHGSPLEAEIRRFFARRILPELERACFFQPTRHEEFKIVRYGAEEGGFFKAHRDNTSKGLQTRRYAVTLNLNAGAYEGGHLVFPEYGEIGYRPATGEAVIFSCSLLHEARPVTAGERFVLLAFLH